MEQIFQEGVSFHMRQLLLVPAMFLGLCSLWGNAWELVYAEVYPDQIASVNFGEWIPVIEPGSMHPMTADLISIWDRLTFISPDGTIISIDEDDNLAELPFPSLENEILHWEQLTYAGGTYFGHVTVADKEEDQLIASDSLSDWAQLPLPPFWNRKRPLYRDQNSLIPYGDTIGLMGNERYASAAYEPHTYIWQGEWVEIDPDPRREWYAWEYYVDLTPYAYLDAEQTWFKFHEPWGDDPYQVRIFRLNEKYEWVNNLATLQPDSRRGQLTTLTCPDGERLVLYGETAELFIIERDGSVQRTNIWNHLPKGEQYVRDVKFINGWYYLLGSATLRTRDFVDFEPVEYPHPLQPVDLLGFGGNLYAFFPDVVYRKPLETGYLDSILMKENWRRSDWLGWFQIIDEETAKIDHLLLGDSTVQQSDDNQYWIRTASLGWIYMRKDWSPWFWRMDDGHWYWLDQDAWPPRAWDYDDQEWEALRPF